MNPETRVVVVGANRAALARALHDGGVTVVDNVRENDPETAPTLNALPKPYGHGHANRHERRKAEKLWRTWR